MSVIGRLVDIAVHQNQNVLSAAQDQAQRLSPQLNRLSGNAVDKLHPALRFTSWEVLEHLGDHGFMRISYLGVPKSW